jgi:hypothetical protein
MGFIFPDETPEVPDGTTDVPERTHEVPERSKLFLFR